MKISFAKLSAHSHPARKARHMWRTTGKPPNTLPMRPRSTRGPYNSLRSVGC